jgi:hypothetical protein
MTVETTHVPPTVADAAHARGEAYSRVSMHQRGYAKLRPGVNRTATARARADWGLAVLEWIDACIAEAEAEDRRDPVWAASRGRRMPARGSRSCDQAWHDYQKVRETRDQPAITAARDAWRTALVDWMQQLAARFAAEDDQNAARAQQRLDEAGPTADCIRPRAASRAQELIHESREREREQSIRRSMMRDAHLPGWTPARLG